MPGDWNPCWIAYHDPASTWLLVVFVLSSPAPARNLQSLDSALTHESTWKITKSNANQSLSHVLFSAFQSSSLLPVFRKYWSIQTSTLDGSTGKTHISSFHLLAQSLEAALLQQHHTTVSILVGSDLKHRNVTSSVTANIQVHSILMPPFTNMIFDRTAGP